MSIIKILETDEAGRAYTTQFTDEKIIISTDYRKQRTHILKFVTKVFLPAGYPDSVSTDYLRYQILNALQAFCSSLAGLFSSRAVLEGFGVGDATATATHALLLTVLQDVFSRLTTIVGAYWIGSSLVPEAKVYRFLADILNDAAIILDTLSPLLNSPLLAIRVPGLRIVALCLSSSLRALCGIAAGGSKAALTVHFATSPTGTGDIGDLNAKDASKETVLALSGMLLGTLIVPYVTTPWSTYPILFLLVAVHLIVNYMAIRGLSLRSLNRQRAGIAWTTYRNSDNSRVLSPAQLSPAERVFERPGVLRDAYTNRVTGQCTIGSSIFSILRRPIPAPVLRLFEAERYLLWFDPQSLWDRPGHQGQSLKSPLRLHICLKEGHKPADQLKAWVHATEVARTWMFSQEVHSGIQGGVDEASHAILNAYRLVDELYPIFMQRMRNAGWTADGALMTGSPKTILTSVQEVGSAPDGPRVIEGKKYL